MTATISGSTFNGWWRGSTAVRTRTGISGVDRLSTAAQSLAWFNNEPTFINDRQQIAAAEENAPGMETAVLISPRKLGLRYLQLQSPAVAPGGTDAISGTGFDPATNVTLALACASKSCRAGQITAVKADAQGSFWGQQITISTTTQPGSYVIYAESGGTHLATVRVTITHS